MQREFVLVDRGLAALEAARKAGEPVDSVELSRLSAITARLATADAALLVRQGPRPDEQPHDVPEDVRAEAERLIIQWEQDARDLGGGE